METKTISIREAAYKSLKSMKREDDSISDAVEMLINKKRNLKLFIKNDYIVSVNGMR